MENYCCLKTHEYTGNKPLGRTVTKISVTVLLIEMGKFSWKESVFLIYDGPKYGETFFISFLFIKNQTGT